MATLRASHFEFGIPMPISIKKAGENVEGKYGDQVRFTTSGGTLYLDPQPASGIEIEMRNQGIRYGDVFSLTRAETGGFIVRRVSGDAGGNNNGLQRAAHFETPSAVAPAPVASVAPRESNNNFYTDNHTPAPSQVSPASLRFMSAYKDAVDVLLEAKTYAQSRGLAIEIRCEDVRCLAATIMIDAKGRG